MNVIQELNRVKKIVYYLQRKVIDGVGNLLSALSDVDIDTPLDGQVLTWDSVLNKWVNAEPTGGSGSGGGGGGSGTVTSVATSAPITGGTITTSGTIGITQATTSTDGYLSSTDWNTFNGKQATGLSWLLASGGTLTGNNTISGAFKLNYNLTGTAASNNDFVLGQWTGTVTARNTANDIVYGYNYNTGFSQQANTQVFLGVNFSNPTITTNGFTGGTSFSASFGSYTNGVQIGTNSSGGIVRFAAGVGAIMTIGFISGQIYFDQTVNNNPLNIRNNTGDTTVLGVLRLLTNSVLNSFNPNSATVRSVLDSSISFSNTTNATSCNFIRYTGTWNSNVAGTFSHVAYNVNSTINLGSSTTNHSCIGFNYEPTVTQIRSSLNMAFRHTSGYVVWQSVLSPAQITSNQNDYNPTGFNSGGAPDGASILRLSSDASRDITGLVGGVSGRLLIISNVGTNDIVFKTEDAGSTAANRFAIAADKTVAGAQSITFWYDGTSSRWRTINV